MKAEATVNQVIYRYDSGGAQTLTPRPEVGQKPVNGVAGNGNLFVMVPLSP